MDVVGHDNVGPKFIEASFGLSRSESARNHGCNPRVSKPDWTEGGTIGHPVQAQECLRGSFGWVTRRRAPKLSGQRTEQTPSDEDKRLARVPMRQSPSVELFGRRNRLPYFAGHSSFSAFSSRISQSGITLIEMIIVLAIVGLITAVSFPAVTSGLDSVRLRGATDTIASFLNAGLNKAERSQTPVEIVISIAENKIKILLPERTRELPMPDSIRIVKIHPELLGTEEQDRSIVLYPNGAVPRFGVEIASSKGAHRIVRVDPITGVPQVE